MSEIMLNLADAERAVYGTVHGSFLDLVVAALSADPETIDELRLALRRFLPPDEEPSYMAHLRPGTHPEPWDAGLAIVDLAARMVVIESTYSSPGPKGHVEIIE